jgi:hypothetical protein
MPLSGVSTKASYNPAIYLARYYKNSPAKLNFQGFLKYMNPETFKSLCPTIRRK